MQNATMRQTAPKLINISSNLTFCFLFALSLHKVLSGICDCLPLREIKTHEPGPRNRITPVRAFCARALKGAYAWHFSTQADTLVNEILLPK